MGAMRPAGERIGAGESGADALRLDGNAAAGILSELFAPDLTAARATCAQCGETRPVGALFVYAHGMGMVMRCPGCDAVTLVAVPMPTGVRISFAALRWVEPVER